MILERELVRTTVKSTLRKDVARLETTYLAKLFAKNHSDFYYLIGFLKPFHRNFK